MIQQKSSLPLLLLSLSACAVPHRVAELPPRQRAWIAVLSGEMPGAIELVARHAWIVASVPGSGELVRWEYLGGAGRSTTSAPFHYFGEGDVAVHGVIEESPEKIKALAGCLDAQVRGYNERHPSYLPIPGPNSNTFVAEALRGCDLHVELPATAIGRDYRGVLGAGVTEAGTGVQVESWVAGARVGLREGVEVHILSLPLGVHFWPPGLTVPVNPGRIGVDLDGHATDEQVGRGRRREQDWDRPRRERKYGLAVGQIFSQGARVVHPSRVGGLAERFTVGMVGRALYGDRLGWGAGFDLELGATAPAGLAWAARLYPAGVGYALGHSGYLGLFAGLGGSRSGAAVPSAFELPAEVRLELDAGPRARLGFRGGTTWIAGDGVRTRSARPGWADEYVLGTYVRVGATERRYGGVMGQGYFFGLERRELMDSRWLGVTVGIEMLGGY